MKADDKNKVRCFSCVAFYFQNGLGVQNNVADSGKWVQRLESYCLQCDSNRKSQWDQRIIFYLQYSPIDRLREHSSSNLPTHSHSVDPRSRTLFGSVFSPIDRLREHFATDSAIKNSYYILLSTFIALCTLTLCVDPRSRTLFRSVFSPIDRLREHPHQQAQKYSFSETEIYPHSPLSFSFCFSSLSVLFLPLFHYFILLFQIHSLVLVNDLVTSL